MYTLKKTEAKGLEFIEIHNSDNSSKATICLNQGGRLSGLEFDGINILAEFCPTTYGANYASAILFPFVNRIKDGTYTFEDVDYILNCNEADKNNALHGLVYDKNFDCIAHELTSNYGAIKLHYKHDGTCRGFPFKFDMLLTYTLTERNFNLSVAIVNEDDQVFPFNVGWHPYFVSKNLDESALNFESSIKYLVDKQQIISGTTSLDVEMPYALKDVELDDGYHLQNNALEFFTPEYGLIMTSTSKDNYLQLYTPSIPNVIAIEPMTGAADSFNNRIGLQTLRPNESYSVKWNITFENLTDKISTNQLIT